MPPKRTLAANAPVSVSNKPVHGVISPQWRVLTEFQCFDCGRVFKSESVTSYLVIVTIATTGDATKQHFCDSCWTNHRFRCEECERDFVEADVVMDIGDEFGDGSIFIHSTCARECKKCHYFMRVSQPQTAAGGCDRCSSDATKSPPLITDAKKLPPVSSLITDAEKLPPVQCSSCYKECASSNNKLTMHRPDGTTKVMRYCDTCWKRDKRRLKCNECKEAFVDDTAIVDIIYDVAKKDEEFCHFRCVYQCEKCWCFVGASHGPRSDGGCICCSEDRSSESDADEPDHGEDD